MSKHSRGPWEWDVEYRDAYTHSGGHYSARASYTSVFMDEGNDFDGENRAEVHGPNQEANARLIAAAPDLLAELKHLLEAYLVTYGEDCPAVERTRAAIAKAEGK